MNLLLFLLITLSFYSSYFEKVFWVAFLSGFIWDLIIGSRLGISSLIFLAICFLIYLYQRKFSSENILFQLVFILVSDLLFNLLNGSLLLIKETFLFMLLTLIIFFISTRLKRLNPDLKLDA